ncbi:MAG: hypothetical protein M3463_18645 [Verrucomicrobiota bacterium]|nr:hypothetical protein [Verrucomicrobiota bacterium]
MFRFLAFLMWLATTAAPLPGAESKAPAPGSSAAPTEIKPPFGLIWGETAERLERLLKGAKATIVARRPLEGGRQAWDVEGLLQTGLKRTVFHLLRGELVEVELQYQKDDWDQAKYDEYMGQVRRALEKKYGQGQLIARKTEPEGDVVKTVVGYKWNLNNTSLELFYFAAQKGPNVFRTLSVHYRGF